MSSERQITGLLVKNRVSFDLSTSKNEIVIRVGI